MDISTDFLISADGTVIRAAYFIGGVEVTEAEYVTAYIAALEAEAV